MIDTRDLGQRYITALWESARLINAGDAAVEHLGGLIEAVTEAEAQLAGLRLHLLNEARLTGADAVVAQVRESVRTNPSQATAAVKLATDLGERFPLIAAALHEGTVSLPQAEAIVAGLRKLPARLTRSEMTQCQESILEHVDVLGPAELRTLAARLLEVIDPEQADADEARRLAAEERAARRNRFLRLAPDFHGSIRITGQLPMADGALLTAQLEALMPSASSYADSNETPTPDMRRADALVALLQAAASTETLPLRGGDRPHVHITMNLDTLISGLGHTTLLDGKTLDSLSAGEARRLACDAHIIPMVLGSDSQPLDVGRQARLFTPAILKAVAERDRGCAFPHCQVAPTSCHAHHIIPWWAGGRSSIDNAVLLCPNHHRLVEPDPHQSPEAQWQVSLDPTTGLPWFTPPTHADPRQRPRQHTRFVLKRISLSAKAPPCPEPPAESRLEEAFAASAAVWTPAG